MYLLDRSFKKNFNNLLFLNSRMRNRQKNKTVVWNNGKKTEFGL